MNFSNASSLVSVFAGCDKLTYLKIKELRTNLSLSASRYISKDSVCYIVSNSNPSSAITITLHPDAYTRLADDADIVAALEAQPLVSLVSV